MTRLLAKLLISTANYNSNEGAGCSHIITCKQSEVVPQDPGREEKTEVYGSVSNLIFAKESITNQSINQSTVHLLHVAVLLLSGGPFVIQFRLQFGHRQCQSLQLLSFRGQFFAQLLSPFPICLGRFIDALAFFSDFFRCFSLLRIALPRPKQLFLFVQTNSYRWKRFLTNYGIVREFREYCADHLPMIPFMIFFHFKIICNRPIELMSKLQTGLIIFRTSAKRDLMTDLREPAFSICNAFSLYYLGNCSQSNRSSSGNSHCNCFVLSF